MGIICRPLLLHNEYVPVKKGDRAWDYCMFGHYDGMTVGEPFELKDLAKLEKLFEICASHDIKQQDYFTQIMFGFHSDREKESAFWNDEKAFLYISLLQVADENICECKEKLESEAFVKEKLKKIGVVGAEQEIKTLVYYSLDNNDLILAIKCQHAKLGENMIASLNQNMGNNAFKIRNSYSILGIRAEDIEAGGKLSEENEKIDLLELKIVEKSYNSIGMLYQKVKEQLDLKGAEVTRLAMLGTEDEIIHIRNAAWKDIAPFYRKETGLLCNANEEAGKYASIVSTKIMLDISARGELEEVHEKKTMKFFCDVLADKIKILYETAVDDSSRTEQKNLMQIVNALWRFEYSYRTNEAFADYNFFTLYGSIYMLLELLKEAKDTYDKSYYEFMMCVKLRTQNFIKPDRVYACVNDFNIRYYDVPAKLITFYSAYVFYFKRALNTNEQLKYEFLILPGATDTTRVTELFPMASETDRLMMINMPEKQIYHLKLVLIILGHEIAHYVGRDVRMREERKEQIIKISGRAISEAMKCYILENEEERWTEKIEHWEELEQQLTIWISKYLERDLKNADYLYDKYGERVEKQAEESAGKTDVLEKKLNNVIEELLLSRGEALFRFALWDQFEEEQKENKGLKWSEYYETNKGIVSIGINEYLGERKNYDDSLNLSNTIQTILYLFRECYADVVCILSLRLSVRDYLGAIKDNIHASKWKVDDVEETLLIARIALVMQSMNEPLELEKGMTECYRWTDDEFDYSVDEEPEIYKLENIVRRFVADHMVQQEGDTSVNRITKVSGCSIAYDRKILLEVLKYLKRCQKTFYSLLEQKVLDKEKMEMVRNFFALVKEQENDVAFGTCMGFLKKFEQDVYAEINSLIV